MGINNITLTNEGVADCFSALLLCREWKTKSQNLSLFCKLHRLRPELNFAKFMVLRSVSWHWNASSNAGKKLLFRKGLWGGALSWVCWCSWHSGDKQLLRLQICSRMHLQVPWNYEAALSPWISEPPDFQTVPFAVTQLGTTALTRPFLLLLQNVHLFLLHLRLVLSKHNCNSHTQQTVSEDAELLRTAEV